VSSKFPQGDAVKSPPCSASCVAPSCHHPGRVLAGTDTCTVITPARTPSAGAGRCQRIGHRGSRPSSQRRRPVGRPRGPAARVPGGPRRPRVPVTRDPATRSRKAAAAGGVPTAHLLTQTVNSGECACCPWQRSPALTSVSNTGRQRTCLFLPAQPCAGEHRRMRSVKPAVHHGIDLGSRHSGHYSHSPALPPDSTRMLPSLRRRPSPEQPLQRRPRGCSASKLAAGYKIISTQTRSMIPIVIWQRSAWCPYGLANQASILTLPYHCSRTDCHAS